MDETTLDPTILSGLNSTYIADLYEKWLNDPRSIDDDWNNWFAEFFQRGYSDQFPEWASVKATYHENPRISDEDIAEAKKTMSEAEFNQEYMADFNTYEGQVWGFNHENCVSDLAEMHVLALKYLNKKNSKFEDIDKLLLSIRRSQLFIVNNKVTPTQ